MHPRYVAKSDFPSTLLNSVGLRSVGSRSRTIRPENWGIARHPDSAVTEDIFVAGQRQAFDEWSVQIHQWSARTPLAAELVHIEDFTAFDPSSKLKTIPEPGRAVMSEVVLHNSGNRVIEQFIEFARHHSADPLLPKRRDVQGLTFIPVRVDSARIETLVQFAFVRVARGMPTLRPYQPGLMRVTPDFSVQLPSESAADPQSTAVIFDCGIPVSARAPLSPWVKLTDPPGIGPAVPAYEQHGLAVTTAFLFGPLASGVNPPRPVCAVEHVRIVDKVDATGIDLEYVDALDRMVKHLRANPGKYGFVNISLGPNLPVEDDEVTAWTATLDDLFAKEDSVVTVAVGNDGHRDASSGLNRVQPPADGVNVLAVGATDCRTATWKRAPYSCVGPGRSPGIVKPDGVVFGGSDQELFGVLLPNLRGGGTQGTSFASPLALRSAASIRAQLGNALGALAIRALLIHRADAASYDRKEIGWGRFEVDPSRLITCDDNEATVVFQGELPIGKHLRAKVPMPSAKIKGRVTVSGTLVIAPEVDPEHPSTYTRSGLEVSFRPHSAKHSVDKDGRRSRHAKTASFFSAANMYGAAEYEVREEGHKWEPCLRNERPFFPSSLQEPCFDIYYHQRLGGTKPVNSRPIRYALIVTLRAPKVIDLYNQVLRAHAKVLVPIKPRIRIQVAT